METTYTADKIKALRARASYTQQQFAAWLGVTREHVAALEGGTRPAGSQTIRLLTILEETIKGRKRKWGFGGGAKKTK